MEAFSFFDFLTMLGGLAMFLFGMSQMGDGLEKASSGKLESVLNKLTSSKLKAVALGAAVILASPASVSVNYMVLTLAIVLGFYVISAVTPRLHTPLMSETNAISGIVLVGAILVVSSTNVIVSSLAFLAIVLSSINIFGGFTITDRMLGMFRKEEA